MGMYLAPRGGDLPLRRSRHRELDYRRAQRRREAYGDAELHQVSSIDF